MTDQPPLDKLVALAKKQYPDADFGFLANSIYSETLSKQDQENCLHLIELARAQQHQSVLFESAYRDLLHLYVLNGSRIDLLRTIDRRLRGLVEGKGALLLLSGVSGIGKTSLVLAFQERMQQLGIAFIAVRCSEQENTAYGFWEEIVRALSTKGISIGDLPSPFSDNHEVGSPQQIRQSLMNWLNKCASQQPLVVLLDDVHWADIDSIEVLNYLTGQLDQWPLLFIATYRSDETQMRPELLDALLRLRRIQHVDSVSIKPLKSQDIERLVTAYYGSASLELCSYLVQRAEGHPLFTVELLHDLISQGLLLQNRNGHWLPPEQSVPVPTVLKELLLQRVKRLGEDVEQLLTIGSVIGETWELKIVEPIVGLAESKLLDALENALKGELVIAEDDKAERYRFSHGLIREVLYTAQLARRRKRFHGQIAAQFEQQQPENVTTIAHHYCEAEMWERAIPYCLAAGEQASRRFAFYSALQWHQQALASAEHVGNVLAPTILFTILDRLGRTYRALEQSNEAESIYIRMRDTSRSHGDLIAEGNALINLTYLQINQHPFDLVEKTAQEALIIAEQTGDPRMLAQVHACLGVLQMFHGNHVDATRHLDEAYTRVQMLDDFALQSEVAKQRGYLSIWSGKYREAETYARVTLASAQKSTDPLVQAGGYQNLAWTQIESGNYSEAFQNLLTVINAGEVSSAHHHNLPRLLNLMGYLHLELGAAEQALVWDQKALAASSVSQSYGEMRRYSLLNMATDYLHLGKLEEANDVIAQFESIKETPESVHFRYYNRYQLLMSEMYLRQQMFDRSIEQAHEARSLADSNSVPKNVARSHWLEGEALAGLTRFDHAVKHLEMAMDIADGIKHGSLRWKIRLSLGAVQARKDMSNATVLRQAHELMDQAVQNLSGSPLRDALIASHWFGQLRELQRKVESMKKVYPAGLTEREVEVLRLVAKGATNQQIANILHVSVRTINTHMTNILNKTGCENRTAASAFAIQHKLVST